LGRGFSSGGKRGNPQEEKIKIYWEEELDKFKECVNTIYLQTGNIEDILSMNYWRFLDIVHTLNKIKTIESGGQIVETKVPQSNKDLIQRLKNLENKK
jgi:hypothetical protein